MKLFKNDSSEDAYLNFKWRQDYTRERQYMNSSNSSQKNPMKEQYIVEVVSKNSNTKQINKKSLRGLIQPPSRVPQQRRHHSCCGRGAHSLQACPAKDIACHKCNKRNIIASCYSRKLFLPFQKRLTH